MSIDFSSVKKWRIPESIAFNQLLPAMETGNWRYDAGMQYISFSDGVMTCVTGAANTNVLTSSAQAAQVYAGHKYCLLADVKATSTNKMRMFMYVGGAVVGGYVYNTVANDWCRLQKFVTPSVNASNSYTFILQNVKNDSTTVYIRNAMMIDMSVMYGAGNEPTSFQVFANDCLALGHDLSVFQTKTGVISENDVAEVTDGNGVVIWQKPSV